MTIALFQTQGSGADGKAYTVMLAGFGSSLAGLVASTGLAPLTLAAVDPLDGCTPFNRPSLYRNKAVLLQRGNCSFESKVEQPLET